MDYAENLFAEVKAFLIEAGRGLLGENEDARNYSERELLEKKLK